jgi:sugar fermentation stimulation protein A
MTGYMETVRTEKTYGDSRLDIYIEERLETGIRKAYIEVKGVTLEEDGAARFPDAPTERGLRHIGELRRIAASGDLAYIIFILQMKGSRSFEPNDRMHPAFGEALRLAAAEGVRPLAYDCRVGPDRIEAADPVPIIL